MNWHPKDKRPAPDNPPSGGSSGKVLPDTPVNVPMPPVKPTLGSRDEDWKERALTAERMLRVEESLAKQLTDAMQANFRMFDMIKYLYRQRVFSEKAFGPGPRAKGVVDHIRKELVEIEAEPADLKEWIDVVTLALDGAWRAGYTPEQIVTQLDATLTRNEKRSWPDWRTVDVDKAIEHDRSVL